MDRRSAANGCRAVSVAPLALNPGALRFRKATVETRLSRVDSPYHQQLLPCRDETAPAIAALAAFHRTHSDIVRRFALPRAMHDQGIKRYGFHGPSYCFIVGELARREPALAKGRVVVAHLGSGASLCGLEGGISRDTLMSFSALDGTPMTTRCGALDPGVLLHLLAQGGYDARRLEDQLYRRSGLLAVSGNSADSRELLDSDKPEAREALDLFCTSSVSKSRARPHGWPLHWGARRDRFIAGIGEHQPSIRAAVAERLAWLGLELDEAANATNAARISRDGAPGAAFVAPTDEEPVIAEDALATVQNGG